MKIAEGWDGFQWVLDGRDKLGKGRRMKRGEVVNKGRGLATLLGLVQSVSWSRDVCLGD